MKVAVNPLMNEIALVFTHFVVKVVKLAKAPRKMTPTPMPPPKKSKNNKKQRSDNLAILRLYPFCYSEFTWPFTFWEKNGPRRESNFTKTPPGETVEPEVKRPKVEADEVGNLTKDWVGEWGNEANYQVIQAAVTFLILIIWRSPFQPPLSELKGSRVHSLTIHSKKGHKRRIARYMGVMGIHSLIPYFSGQRRRAFFPIHLGSQI